MSRLAWNVQNAISAQITPGIGVVALVGEMQVYPTVSTNYVLTATFADGSVQQTTHVVDPILLSASPSSYSGTSLVGVNSSVDVATLVNGPFTLNRISGVLPAGTTLSVVGDKLHFQGAPFIAGTYTANYTITGPSGSVAFQMNFVATIPVTGSPVGSSPVSSPVGSTPVSSPVSTPVSTPVSAPVGSMPLSFSPSNIAYHTMQSGVPVNVALANIVNGPITSAVQVGGVQQPGTTLTFDNVGHTLRLTGTPSGYVGYLGVVWQLTGPHGVANFGMNLTTTAPATGTPVSTPVGSPVG